LGEVIERRTEDGGAKPQTRDLQKLEDMEAAVTRPETKPDQGKRHITRDDDGQHPAPEEPAPAAPAAVSPASTSPPPSIQRPQTQRKQSAPVPRHRLPLQAPGQGQSGDAHAVKSHRKGQKSDPRPDAEKNRPRRPKPSDMARDEDKRKDSKTGQRKNRKQRNMSDDTSARVSGMG